MIKALAEGIKGMVTACVLPCSGFYFGLAPQGTGLPYVTAQFIPHEHGMALNETHYEDFTIQFSVFDASTSLEDCADLASYMCNAFDAATLGVTGYDVTSFTRKTQPNLAPIPQEEGGGWMAVVDYEVLMQATP